MNKQRRKEIDSLIEQVEILKDKIQAVYDEEENYRDSIPESFIEKYETANNACTALDNAITSLDDIIENLTNARDSE